MQQLEDDLADAFRLIPTLAMVNLGVDLFRKYYSQFLDASFDGLLPCRNTPAQRESSKDATLPPKGVLHIIERVGTTTMREFLNQIVPTTTKHLDRQVLVLLTTALDSLLERKGFHGTLGQRFVQVQAARSVPTDLDNDMQEIIQRRNNTAHGGVVSHKYLTGAAYPGMIASSWVRQ